MARRLRDRIERIPGARLLFPTEANSVFVDLAPAVIQALHAAGWKFYTFIGEGGCRLMCAWDTTEADVDSFADDLTRMVAESPGLSSVAGPTSRSAG
jgi:threonine aldolase